MKFKFLILIVLVLAALFIPQVIFQMQDNLLYSKTMLSERERVDVETLSTAYEKSLPLRMQYFAECLEAGDNFYVTSRDLPITREVYDYLYSDQGFYQTFYLDLLWYLAEKGLLSAEFIEDAGHEVNQWKQYVIYSDDYAKGVNFILWYIELQDSAGEILKILADAETGTIYALKEENAQVLREWTMGLYDSENGLTCYWRQGVVIWNLLARYYEVVTQEDIEALIKDYNGRTEKEWLLYLENLEKLAALGLAEETDAYLVYYYYGFNGLELKTNVTINGKPIWQEKMEGFSDEKNVIGFRLSYGETPFEAVLDMRDAEILDTRDAEIEFELSYGAYVSQDIAIGIRQIYELIPEFSR